MSEFTCFALLILSATSVCFSVQGQIEPPLGAEWCVSVSEAQVRRLARPELGRNKIKHYHSLRNAVQVSIVSLNQWNRHDKRFSG